MKQVAFLIAFVSLWQMLLMLTDSSLPIRRIAIIDTETAFAARMALPSSEETTNTTSEELIRLPEDPLPNSSRESNDSLVAEQGLGERTSSPSSNETTNIIASKRKPYYGDFFEAIGEVIRPFHGSLSIFLCSTAIVVNIINVVVLTT